MENEKDLVRPADKSKRWWICLGIVLAVGLAIIALGKWSGERRSEQSVKTAQIAGELVPQTSQTESSSDEAQSSDTEVVFSARIFDPEKVSHITPLGELNGGYVETQPINGLGINLKKDANGNAEPMEVYAPIDMTLEDYSYAPDPQVPDRPVQWHLGFRISKDMKLSFDHISWVPDEIKAVTPPTPNSGYVPPIKKLSFKAGELIAKTSGTREAHNWNIYLRDNQKTNAFVNQARYEKLRNQYDYVNAVCPFDYYEDSQKAFYLALMGYSKAGQSKTCGTNSKDAKGSISGLWHLDKEGMKDDYQGSYATPFSVYKTSANEIVLYETNRQRYVLGVNNKSYQDPATVTDFHCYDLTIWSDDKKTQGYAYFKVVSDMEMKMNYSASGSCPATFPEDGAIIYYR
ncbi:MAG: hypothetical protein WCT32_02080 [Patescibacteria group bacterium]|jgi:hypothetical protein